MNKSKSKKKKIIIIASIIVSIVLILGGIYFFVSSKEKDDPKEKGNTIKEGNVSLTLNKENVIEINKPYTDEEGEAQTPHHFTLKNESDKEQEYTIYLDDIELESNEQKMNDNIIKYSLIKDGEKKTEFLLNLGESTNRILDKGTLAGGQTITYDLRLWTNNETNDQVFKGKLRMEVKEQEKPSVEAPEETSKPKNPNILAIYKYDATCQTGEETNCHPLQEPPKTYEAGTIINYRINNDEAKYFYVLFDNGNTLTLQQRENTIVDPISWYDKTQETASQTTNNNESKEDPKVMALGAMFLAGTYWGDNDKGPLTVLKSLENVTANWTNVKDQTYTMGVTTFKENAFTGCSYDFNTKKTSCSENRYTMPERTGKARMITVQEALALGCQEKCPAWMHDYLFDNTITINFVKDPTSIEYWTMSAPLSGSGGAYAIGYDGKLRTSFTSPQPIGGGSVKAGARAVVVIDK